jgi:hypothetical protein
MEKHLRSQKIHVFYVMRYDYLITGRVPFLMFTKETLPPFSAPVVFHILCNLRNLVVPILQLRLNDCRSGRLFWPGVPRPAQ